MNTVATAVAEKISAIAPSVHEKIVTELVGRETKKRADAFVKVYDALEKLEKDMRKIKPDQIGFDETKKVVSETFSKTKIEEKEKLQKKIDKHTGAINKALDKGDYGDLYNLASGKDTGDAVPAADAEDAA